MAQIACTANIHVSWSKEMCAVMHAGDIRVKIIVKLTFLYAMKADGTRKRRAVSLAP